MNSYYEGTLVTVQCDFTTAVQAPVDPSSAQLKWGLKGGSATVISSGFDNPQVGALQWNIDTIGLPEGIYQAQWTGAGSQGRVVQVDEFYLYADVF